MTKEKKSKIGEFIKKRKKILICCLIVIIVFIATFIGCKYYYKDKVIFKLNGEEEVNIEYGEEYIEQNATAKIFKKELTNIFILSDVDVKKLGTYHVTYTLESKIFPTKTITRKVNVIDTTKPVITLNKKETSIIEGSTLSLPNYAATDNYDGDITKNVVISNEVNTKKVGTYNVTYTVKDSSNNETTEIFKVYVKEKPKEKETKKEVTVNVNEVSNAYIKVSISKQKMYYYENDELIIETDVVTGKDSTPTPTGSFKVTGKARNTILRGSDYASFVKYWIAFIKSAYGIHDASWRSEFGGEIYKKNGSHGCVNTPTDAVAKLYERVKVGTPVYIE